MLFIRNSSSTNGKILIAETTGPESDKIWVQAIVLSKNEVKKGAITSTNKMLRYLPDLKAIVYASG